MKCNYCNYEVRDTALYCPNCGEDPKTTKKKEIKKVTKKEEKKNQLVLVHLLYHGDYLVSLFH